MQRKSQIIIRLSSKNETQMIIFKGFHRGGGGGVGIFILLIIASSYLSKLRKAYFYLFATFISWQIGRVAGFGLGKDRLKKKRRGGGRRGLQPRRKGVPPPVLSHSSGRRAQPPVPSHSSSSRFLVEGEALSAFLSTLKS